MGSEAYLPVISLVMWGEGGRTISVEVLVLRYQILSAVVKEGMARRMKEISG